MAVISVIFFLNDNKLSSHMDQISEHINYSNEKNHSYDQMRKIIVNLGSKKCENNNNSTCQLSCLQNFLLVNIVDTLEIFVLNVDHESDTRKKTYIFSKIIINIIFLFFTCNVW